MDTLFLRIISGDQKNTYTTELFKSNNPESLATGRFSMTDDALKQMVEDFSKTATASKSLEQIGDQLYALVAQKDLDSDLNVFEDTRLMLDVQPDELRRLPWELLRRDGLFLATRKSTPILRGAWEEFDVEQWQGWPLKLLIVVGTAEEDNIAAQDEIALIGSALMNVDPDVDIEILRLAQEENPYQTLNNRLAAFQPNIFHFIGHAGVTSQGEAYLELHNKTKGQTDLWKVAAITQALDTISRPNLRLVFINACRSDVSWSSGVWSIAQACTNAGARAVIGTRSDIESASAAQFAGAFYTALAEGITIDVAVATARARTSGLDTQGLDRREWATPCLQVNCAPESVLQIGFGIDNIVRGWVKSTLSDANIRTLVDRRQDRWKVWDHFSRKNHTKNVMLITGPPKIGKTKFAHLLMERCALCGHRLLYLNLRTVYQDGRSVDVAGLLRFFASQEPARRPLVLPDRDELPFDAFEPVVQRLAQTIQQRPPHLSEQDAIHSDANELFKVLRQCLDQITEQPPLVLALDHLEAIDPSTFLNFVMPYLIKPYLPRLRRDDEPGSYTTPRLVFILLSNLLAYRELKLSMLEPFCHGLVSVGSFHRNDLQELVTEYVRRAWHVKQITDPDREQKWLNMGNGFAQVTARNYPQEWWYPNLLEELGVLMNTMNL